MNRHRQLLLSGHLRKSALQGAVAEPAPEQHAQNEPMLQTAKRVVLALEKHAQNGLVLQTDES